MKQVRKIIRIDEEKCNGCGLCVPSCAEGAIRVIDGKARLVAEKYCDGLGACLGECPQGALTVIDAEVEAFDEEASKALVLTIDTTPPAPSGAHAAAAHFPQPPPQHAAGKPLPCGCPSSLVQTFSAPSSCERANVPVSRPASGVSALTQWPIQIRLVPPTAPFLHGTDLLVASDCVPAAYCRFHDDLLRGRTLLIGCPKFDDADAYMQKFAAIFSQAEIKSVTVAVMQVPCCQGMPAIVRKALALAGKKIPLEVATISTRGDRL